jgi:hypothetical protein
MESEKKIEEWIEKSMCYRWLHRKSSSYFYNLDLLFTYLIVVIGFFNAIATFVCNTYFDNQTDVKNLETFIVTSSSLAISGIAQLHRKAKFYEKSENHNSYSKQFEVFNRKIRIESFFDKLTDESFKKFVNEYNDLANACPSVPIHVIKQFNYKYGNLKLWKPNALYDLKDLKDKHKHIPIILKSTFYKWLYFTKHDMSTNV